MARQLDLFAASRTTEYRNSHTTVPRRLHTTGRGNARVERRVAELPVDKVCEQIVVS